MVFVSCSQNKCLLQKRKAVTDVENNKAQLLDIIEQLSENEVTFVLEFLKKILHID